MNGLTRWGPIIPWLVLTALLIVGGPIFVCLPLWADATLYDLAARNLRDGGILYRDIFDTNLPGMVWLHLLIRQALGWSSEILRGVDLLVYSGIVALLGLWLRRLGKSMTTCGWAAVALFGFYFSLSEISHCQRDVWMLLPALGAFSLRAWRLEGEEGSSLVALFEGILWAMAFWIKPFVLVPAAACLMSPMVMQSGTGRRLDLRDLGYVLLGGILVLGAGLAWIGHSGAFPYLKEVFIRWNPEYLAGSTGWMQRSRFLCRSCIPWSFLHLLAVPIAVGCLVLVRWRTTGRSAALLAAFYLGWLIQAAYVQKGLEYSLASALPPGLILIASLDWWPGRLRLGTAALTAFAGLALWRHPLLHLERLTAWERCCREGSSVTVRDQLALIADRNAPSWEDLDRVADFLKSREMRDGELTCFNNSTHSLYLSLHLKPSTRFLHYDTILMCFPTRREEIRQLLTDSRQRYVVSDLRAVPLTPAEAAASTPSLPAEVRQTFPWSLPVVFRAGRYQVHRVPQDRKSDWTKR